MSIEFIIRLIGMVVFCILGVTGGIYLGRLVNINPVSPLFPTEAFAVIFGLVGALFGLVLTPYITIRPIRALRSIMGRLSAQTLFSSLIGLIVGLIIAALFAFPISLLPKPFGNVLPFVGVVIFGYLGVAVFTMRQNDLLNLLRSITQRNPQGGLGGRLQHSRSILLDTSVIIDGRIADIARTGFLAWTLLIPRFILNELQYIADSPDSLRRQRGRRGMDVLSQLQKDTSLGVKISDIDVEGARETDDKLVILARQLRCPVLTNDYNLNRIAEIQGVTVLNVNELANAVKTILLPGESIHIRVIQEGKESTQGVGYMDDGTMVVIENGIGYLNKEIPVTVTKVFQTAAGRMIFARPNSEH